MALSAITLLDSLRDHLAADAALTALIPGGLFHARADLEAACPLAIYQLPRLDHESTFGPQDSAGATADAVIVLTGVDESSGDTATLTQIAVRLHIVLLHWAPSMWSVRNLTLDTERLDAFVSSGRSYQTASMQYSAVLERT